MVVYGGGLFFILALPRKSSINNSRPDLAKQPTIARAKNLTRRAGNHDILNK
jgi:hypothetical protein